MLERWLTDCLIALRFFSRLPLPLTPREAALGSSGLGEALALVPLAGALVGACPALILAIALGLHLPASVAAILAISTAVGLTGALHEDGLADCADGFGGGTTRERKLAIMRDSRIGAFGAAALVLSLLLRVVALAEIVLRDPLRAGLVLIAAGALSRTLCLMPVILLPPARGDGVGASAAARFDRRLYGIALGVALGLSALPLAAGAPFASVIVAVLWALGGAFGLSALARRQIGGQTGDVAGAVQQIAEIAILLVFSAD